MLSIAATDISSMVRVGNDLFITGLAQILASFTVSCQLALFNYQSVALICIEGAGYAL